MVKGLAIHYRQKIPVKKSDIHKLVAFLIKELQINFHSLEITFVTDAEMQEINKNFLNHDYTTDIVTFDYGDSGEQLKGELIISPAVALHNAQIYQVTHREELYRLVVHGILHLLGYDDKTASVKKKMFSLQEALIEKIIPILT